MFNVVLVEPEIPANTGNVARTCSVTGCSLHLVEPLGFSIDNRQLKRAGLDYWHLLDVHIYRDIDEFLAKADGTLLFFASTRGGQKYTDVCYPPGAYLVFGKETKGLPDSMLERYPDRTVRIPMRSDVRSLNLSNSVAILVYEAFRQNDFAGLR